MAEQRFAPTRGSQEHNPQLFHKAYEKIVERKYPGVESMVGAQFWGQNELEVRGIHNEVLMHTGLLGGAANLGDDLRASVPMATYATAEQVIAGWEILGIGYEFFPEELQDDLYDIVAPRVGDLPKLLTEAEEDEHFAKYNDGETATGGWTKDPLFVDGVTDYLQIIGNKGVNYGSNIIKNAGGVSYHLIALLEQYGDNFIDEEGRLAPLRIERIMCSRQNATLFRMYYGVNTNIEQDNPNVPSPIEQSAPQIIATHRLANPNDIIVFYEGWMDDMKERSKFRAQTMTETVGHLNKKKSVTITRSRFSYYWFSNRRVVLVKGAAA